MGRARSFSASVDGMHFYILLLGDTQLAFFRQTKDGRQWLCTVDRDRDFYWFTDDPLTRYRNLEDLLRVLRKRQLALRLDPQEKPQGQHVPHGVHVRAR